MSRRTYSVNPINGSNNSSSQLTANGAIAVRAGSGRFAKVRIDLYGYNLGITWVTYS